MKVTNCTASVAAFATLAVLAAACGGSSGTGASSAGSSSAGSNCGNNLKIGILTDFSGDLGSFGQADLNGFKLAINQMNSSPAKPKGWKVTDVVQDQRTDATTGVELGTQMMRNHLSFIVGLDSNGIVGLVQPAARYQVPVISQFAGTVTLNTLGGKWIYRTVASDASDGKAAAKWLLSQHASNVVALVADDQSTVSVGHTTQAYYKAHGGTIKKLVVFTPGQASYESVVTQALAAKPSYVFLAGGQSDGTTILKELRSGGYSGPVIVSSDMAVPQVISALGSAVGNNVYAEEPLSDTSLPAYKTFLSAYTAAFHKQPGLFSANSYDAVMLGELAAVAAKSTCGAAINSKIRDVANPPGTQVSSFTQAAQLLGKGQQINYQGASGPVDLDSSGTSQGSYAIMQAKGGTWNTQVAFYPASSFSS